MTPPEHVKAQWPKSLASGLISVKPALSETDIGYLGRGKDVGLRPRRKYKPRARKTA